MYTHPLIYIYMHAVVKKKKDACRFTPKVLTLISCTCTKYLPRAYFDSLSQ